MKNSVLKSGVWAALLPLIGAAPALGAPFSARQIDHATSVGLVDFNYGNTGATIWANDSLHRGPAMLFLAQTARDDFQNGTHSQSSSGVSVRTRLLAHLRNLLVSSSTASNEPTANGGIYGWAEGPVAVAIALAKTTNDPAVWGALSATEKDKFDWIMRALAVAGHWSIDDDNDFRYLLDGTYQFNKAWNPNHWDGQVAALVAARFYFGQSEFDAIFTDFRKSDYLTAFAARGFRNIRWNVSETVMDEGGALPAINGRSGGSGLGVRGNPHRFKVTNTSPTWDGQNSSLQTPAEYFRLVLENFLPKTVSNTGSNLRGYILTGSTPFLGQNSQFDELSNGERSSVRYAYDGWRAVLPTYGFLKEMSAWSGAFAADLDARFSVGTEDMLYKYLHGYHSYSNGEQLDHWQPGRDGLGYHFNKALWRQSYGPAANHPNRSNANPIQIESFDESGSNPSGTRIGQYGFVNSPSTTSSRIAEGIRTGDWAVFHDVNLGNLNATHFRLRAAIPVSDVSVTVEVGNGVSWSGIGTFSLPSTGSATSYVMRKSAIGSTGLVGTGVKSVRLTFSGPTNTDLGNMDWFQFSDY